MRLSSMKSGNNGTPGPIPISRSHTLTPFLDFMIRNGAPVDRWLERCQLPSRVYEDPKSYIPTMNYWKFVSLAENKEGFEDIGLQIGRDHFYEIQSLRLVESILEAPTLLAGVEEYSRRVAEIHSGSAIVLLRGENDSVRLILKRTYDPGIPGFSNTEWVAIISMIGIVQLFAGRRWQPEVVSLMSRRVIPPIACALYPDVHFMRAQPESYIAFPKKLLSLGPRRFGAEVVSRLRSNSSNLTPAAPLWISRTPCSKSWHPFFRTVISR